MNLMSLKDCCSTLWKEFHNSFFGGSLNLINNEIISFYLEDNSMKIYMETEKNAKLT